MLLRELKEEFKESEGDPVIKGKMKQVRNSRMRKRMICLLYTSHSPQQQTYATLPLPNRLMDCRLKPGNDQTNAHLRD